MKKIEKPILKSGTKLTAAQMNQIHFGGTRSTVG